MNLCLPRPSNSKSIHSTLDDIEPRRRPFVKAVDRWRHLRKATGTSPSMTDRNRSAKRSDKEWRDWSRVPSVEDVPPICSAKLQPEPKLTLTKVSMAMVVEVVDFNRTLLPFVEGRWQYCKIWEKTSWVSTVSLDVGVRVSMNDRRLGGGRLEWFAWDLDWIGKSKSREWELRFDGLEDQSQELNIITKSCTQLGSSRFKNEEVWLASEVDVDEIEKRWLRSRQTNWKPKLSTRLLILVCSDSDLKANTPARSSW